LLAFIGLRGLHDNNRKGIINIGIDPQTSKAPQSVQHLEWNSAIMNLENWQAVLASFVPDPNFLIDNLHNERQKNIYSL
jgi:hypothetical protein